MSYDPPVFLTPLRSLKVTEGHRAHFEAKVHPVGDPSLTVKWFRDGEAISDSHRVNFTNRLGIIADYYLLSNEWK